MSRIIQRGLGAEVTVNQQNGGWRRVSPAADEAVLAEQGLEGWAADLEAEDRR